MRTRLVTGLLATTLGAALGLRALRAQVRSSIFIPPPAAPVPALPGGVALRTHGRHPVDLLYAPPAAGAPTVVYFHGNGSNLATSLPRLTALRELGVGLAAVEYVGYGVGATARPTQQRVERACAEAMELVLAQPGTDRVVLLGYSLGAAFAVRMAARGYGDRLVLAAPFSSAQAIARLSLPWAPAWPLFGRYPLDSVGAAPGIAIPTLVVHGVRDEQIPVAMGRKLAAAFPEGRFLEVAGADHAAVGDLLAEAVRIALTDPATWPQAWPAGS